MPSWQPAWGGADMKQVLTLASHSSKALSYLLGGISIALALSVYATTMAPHAIAQWTLNVFGLTFLVSFGGLLFLTLYAWVRMGHATDQRLFWRDLGFHAANGVSTLALTFTLLGMSLGIGSLADQPLTPETIQDTIGTLTQHFSLAFLTTVIGLPSAAVLRALIDLSFTRQTATKRHLS